MLEFLAPGVFLTEIPFHVHPIEGVATSDAGPLAADAAYDHAPEWVAHNEHDPGITTVQLSSWATESLAFRLGSLGIASGLDVSAADPAGSAAVTLTPGQAVRPDGEIIGSLARLFEPLDCLRRFP